jgi:hypothetical protein
MLIAIVRDQPQLLRLSAGWLMALLIVVPLLAVPTLIALRSMRPVGLAIVVVAALVALYPLGVFGLFSFASEGLGAPVVLFVLVVTLLVCGIAAYRGLPEQQRVSGHWVLALLIVAAYAVGAHSALTALSLQREAAGATAKANDAAAYAALVRISRCARDYFERTQSYPRALDELVGDGCLPGAVLAAGRVGHTFDYVPGIANANGAVPMFAVQVAPIRVGVSGWQSGFVDDVGESVVGFPMHAYAEPLDAAELSSAAGVWGRRVRLCAMRTASDQAYPVDLHVIQTHQPHCLPWQVDGRVWYRNSDGQLSYITDSDDAGNPFYIVARTPSGSLYFDSAGRWGAIDRSAPGRLPLHRRGARALSVAESPADVATDLESMHHPVVGPLEVLQRDCAALDAPSCTRLAQILLGADETFKGMSDRVSIETTVAGLEALCDGADVDSCYLLGRVLARPGASPVERRSAERILFASCDAWSAYCLDAAQVRLSRKGTASAATLEIAERSRCHPPATAYEICAFVKADYAQRCDAREARACLALADQFYGDDLDRAPPNAGWGLVDHACDLGEAAACDRSRYRNRRGQ